MQQEPGSRVPDAGGDVSVRVRQVIGETGCSQREFARRIVMDPSKLSRSLSGSRRFTVAELARIADAGGVDAAWLLGASGTGGNAAAPGVPSVTRAAARAGTAAGTAAGTGSRNGSRNGSRTEARHGDAVAAASPEGGRPLQIVRETVRLIAEHGFHSVRVSDIAEACSTSTAAIHYHFPGRAELLEAAVRWCMDEDTARRAARAAQAGDDAADELRRLVELQIPRDAQQRRQWLVWLDLWAEAARSTAVGQLHADYYRQWRTTVADVIRRGIEQGLFRAVDPEFAALRLTALIDGLAAQALATAPEAGEGGEAMRRVLLAHIDTELSARPAR
ncbi:TetR/AcrR family transcriptional regulator [Streptomyces marispadix]|uniref:TetR family transcriptional regulator C-terminal domain-containing protein n=1 Tax=Streptomyces marispadix TaxID=2922868 RepID=A0ABS9T0B4_9ACTN|nr:TetR/AcrR family transcriptional regulator [Streptomyces marispadix]MCH6161952.1 TetR family transcriptional regulator C-terminal domain-containing protein [Streptomyces marispadix]